MNKIAQYLNEHILGEITSSKSIRQRFSRDASILSIMPELVLFPRVTNDIRKAARFSWQLAEKGHTLPLTIRGGGTDTTGAAIGKGLIISTPKYLNNVIHIALKDKDHFVHVQPGVTFKTLNETLSWHGLTLPTYPQLASQSTVGGAVAKNIGGELSGKVGTTGDWVKRLEVVLANGDLIETTRISKRDFSKKIGLQTFEGEIYRKIDGLIEDNQALINERLADNTQDNTGYARIAQVKQRDGSFDLTPLFIGSQGTLGVISELVLKTEYVSKEQTAFVAAVLDAETARDAVDALRKIDPAALETIDGAYYENAGTLGKSFPFSSVADSTDVSIGSVIYGRFNDFNDHARAHKLKKSLKILSKFNAVVATTNDHAIEEIEAVRDVATSLEVADNGKHSYVPLLDGAQIASDHQEEFARGVGELANKHHVALPLHIRALDGVVFTRPLLELDRVSDKQKIFKLIADYGQLVEKHGGMLLVDGSEGRLKANAAYSLIDEDVERLYEQIRAIFDPFGTLNPGVKQTSELRDLVQALRSSYDLADFI